MKRAFKREATIENNPAVENPYASPHSAEQSPFLQTVQEMSRLHYNMDRPLHLLFSRRHVVALCRKPVCVVDSIRNSTRVVNWNRQPYTTQASRGVRCSDRVTRLDHCKPC